MDEKALTTVPKVFFGYFIKFARFGKTAARVVFENTEFNFVDKIEIGPFLGALGPTNSATSILRTNSNLATSKTPTIAQSTKIN